MKIARVALSNGQPRLALVEQDNVRLLEFSEQCRGLTELLESPDPAALARALAERGELRPLSEVQLLAPLEQQEVWAAGVTYKRSQVARMEESETAASNYDRVYTAARPELFFKATPHRVAGPGEPVRIRVDTTWSVPEPELALVLTRELKLVGYTIGNDMSARDIEGENPLYLPQAKMYNDCCSLGPWILLAEGELDRPGTQISLSILRGGNVVFEGTTDLGQMARTFADLVEWLGKDNSFPNGVILLTGTGIVPPNDFTLAAGDQVSIEVTGLGTLVNPVVQGGT